MGYHVLWQIKQGIIQDLESDIKDDRKEAIIPAKLEQMVKKIKAHLCAMGFDHSVCKANHKGDLPGDYYLQLTLILWLFINIYCRWR